MSLFCDCRTDCVEHTAETELCCVLGFLFFVRATTTDSIFRTYGSHSRGRSHAPTRAVKLVLYRCCCLWTESFLWCLSRHSHTCPRKVTPFFWVLSLLCAATTARFPGVRRVVVFQHEKKK